MTSQRFQKENEPNKILETTIKCNKKLAERFFLVCDANLEDNCKTFPLDDRQAALCQNALDARAGANNSSGL